MNEYFSVCATEMYQRRYMDFLLMRYEQLNLPYAFPVAFNFIASPVMLGQECVLIFNEDGDTIGAFGYIHGTGEGNYEDRHVVQIQIAYLDKPYRCTSLFARGLQFLYRHLADQKEEVGELIFWTKPDAYSRRLFGKLARRQSVQEAAVDVVDAYRMDMASLESYLSGLRGLEAVQDKLEVI